MESYKHTVVAKKHLKSPDVKLKSMELSRNADLDLYYANKNLRLSKKKYASLEKYIDKSCNIYKVRDESDAATRNINLLESYEEFLRQRLLTKIGASRMPSRRARKLYKEKRRESIENMKKARAVLHSERCALAALTKQKKFLIKMCLQPQYSENARKI